MRLHALITQKLCKDGALPSAREKRYSLKLAIEELSALLNRKVNDIIDEHGINREYYWYQVDPLDSAEPPPNPKKQKRNRRDFSRPSELTAVQKIGLWEKVEELRLNGEFVPVACEKVGIYTTQYYEWDMNIRELRKQAKEAVDVPKTEPVKRRFITDIETQQEVTDAVSAISVATGEKARSVVRQMGVSYDEVRAWPKPIISRRMRNAETLTLKEKHKARIMKSMPQAQSIGKEPKEILAGLGLPPEEMERLLVAAKGMRTMKKKKDEQETSILTVQEAHQLVSKYGLSRTDAQEWCRAWNLQDLASLGSIPDHYPQHLDEHGIYDSWMRYLENKNDAAAKNALATHYLPLIDTVFTAHYALSSANHEHELKSDGYLTLMKCMEKYDPRRNIKFISYFVGSVQNQMSRQATKLQYGTNSSTFHSVRIAAGNIFAETGHTATPEQLEKRTGKRGGVIKRVLNAPHQVEMPDENGDDVFITNARSVDLGASSDNMTTVDPSPLTEILNGTLDEREQRILFARARGETLVEVGRSERVTKERVRQIEVRAIRKIRAVIKQRVHTDDSIASLSERVRSGQPMDLSRIAALIEGEESTSD